MRARDLFLIPGALGFAVVGLWFGGRWSYIAVRNRAPVEMTCAELYAEGPRAEWISLRDCEVDPHLAWADPTDPHGQLFVVLRPPGPSYGVPAKLVGIDAGGGGKLSGLVELGVERSERTRQELRDRLRLDREFTVLDVGSRPEPLANAFGALAMGLGATGYLGWRWKRRKRKKQGPALAKATVIRS